MLILLFLLLLFSLFFLLFPIASPARSSRETRGETIQLLLLEVLVMGVRTWVAGALVAQEVLTQFLAFVSTIKAWKGEVGVLAVAFATLASAPRLPASLLSLGCSISLLSLAVTAYFFTS